MRGYSSSRSQRLCERLFVQKVPGGMQPLQWVLFSDGKYLGIWRLLLLRLECILKFIAHHIYLHNHTKIFLSKDRYIIMLPLFFDDFILDEKDSVNLFTVHFFSHFDWLLYLTELWLVCLIGMTETCYSCDFVHDQRTCNTTTVCGQGEVSFSLITLTLYYDLAN